MIKFLAACAVFPAGATFYFWAFWTWFDFWRRHRFLTYGFMFVTFGGIGMALSHWRGLVFADRVHLPVGAQVAGWLLVLATFVLAMVADRQIGLHIRTFAPFFNERERIQLRTTGAYAVVRHPIYAAGIGYQVGAFLATGYLAILPAFVVLALGAIWFTRQEERRLTERLADPAAYERYRARVPALLPWPRPRSR